MNDPDEKAIAELCREIRKKWIGGIPHGPRLPCKLGRVVFGFDLPRTVRLSGLNSQRPGIPQPPRDKA